VGERRGDGVLYPLNSVSQFNLINRPKKEIWFTEESHGKNSAVMVMMFLEAQTIPGLIANMQRCTKTGGYNLIVAAMDTPDFPCTV
ncbi:hypothetical protein ONO57_26180, partial [Salmonella enterica subsp. enterica serovar Anatum]|nr:hypothetical protein [Salmonella enterica subsp. enterica serovar Anatum]